MDESTKKLIKLLEKNYTIDTIKRKMNLTNAQLAYRLHMLKYNGYAIEKKYYANGDITAKFQTEVDFMKNCRKIYTKTEEEKIRFLVISDLHYFHKDENRRVIDSAFNYCVKNGIHIIFICGDLIDALKNNTIPIENQAEMFIKLYPQDDSIINFCVLGNHDIKSAQYNNTDLKTLIESKRLDIVSPEYGNINIRIKNDILSLRHPVQQKSTQRKKFTEATHLTFFGHSHTAKSKEKAIYVPSLSNVKTNKQKDFAFLPQALDSTIYFNPQNRMFSKILIDQLIMTDDFHIISETTLPINTNNPAALNLEIDEYPSIKEKTKSL